MATDFLEELGKTIIKTADKVSKKTDDFLEVQKLKNKIYENHKATKKLYMEIGRQVYEQFKAGQNEEFLELCNAIHERDNELIDLKKQLKTRKEEI